LPRTVLIVDDSPTIRASPDLLKPLQIEVEEAEDGAKPWRWSGRARPRSRSST